jgi:hypothetical protein
MFLFGLNRRNFVSITLTTPIGVTITGPSPVTENDTIGACTSMTIDYFAQVVTFIFQTGVIQSGNINAGKYGPIVTLVVNLITGQWSASTGQSGTIGAGALSSFNAQLKSDRNLVETFASNNITGLLGSQVAWT